MNTLLKIKVEGGTAAAGDGKGLCPSCAYASTRETFDGNTTIKCSVFRDIVRSPVLRCSEYRHANQPSRSDFERIAWEITTDKRNGRIGFITPTERRKNGNLPDWIDD